MIFLIFLSGKLILQYYINKVTTKLHMKKLNNKIAEPLKIYIGIKYQLYSVDYQNYMASDKGLLSEGFGAFRISSNQLAQDTEED